MASMYESEEVKFTKKDTFEFGPYEKCVEILNEIDEQIKNERSKAMSLMNLFVISCKGGHIPIIELIIHRSNHIKNGEWWAAGLYGACEGGQMDIVKYMVNQGATAWNRALHAACRYNHKNIIKYIIKQGADDMNIGLIGGCQGGYMNVVTWMMSLGADNYQSALQYACEDGNKKIIKFLQKKGANYYSTEAFRGACQGGHTKMVREIFKQIKHDDPTEILKMGSYSASYGGHLNIVKFLMGHDVNSWRAALHGACRGGQMNIIKYVITKDTNHLNYLTTKGFNHACKNGHIELAEFLYKLIKKQ